MRSFYLRFRVYAIRKWPFFWNLSSNWQSSLVFLYANSLYGSLFLESLSLAYNEVQLYTKPILKCLTIYFVSVLWYAEGTSTDPYLRRLGLRHSRSIGHGRIARLGYRGCLGLATQVRRPRSGAATPLRRRIEAESVIANLISVIIDVLCVKSKEI